ncbi:TadE/TadG family type IV pilus assembly protein [Bradyrhizobium sp.]|jgi:Flp pilus assembly protein TadG/ACT domain-containing protein|uniref:TadE/TadG family type IV pilus assembly protein n=1 Tax=Bradyrhizobium sp. TaxID=376 RepID=UPI002DDD76EC|nr:TadE/TadG family type IV pilus assembly protein [Bradyrhizobium sp.]HEV2156123.1 TadE/TadG family type IV pilus assembly protein [Bradyrhizobium sp.]
MLRLPVVSRIGRNLARFTAAEQGNIAVLFAIALVPVLGFVGAAIDYSRAVQARSSLQVALDSAALMVSKDLTNGTITEADIETKTKSYFSGLYTGKSGTVDLSTIHATYTPKDSNGISNIVVTGSGSMTTDFMRIAGYPTLGFSTSSTAAWGNTRMRVAMILDNTGSMAQNGKMSAMQTAAKDMIDTLSGYNKQTGDVYISIVPFAKDVNVGTTNGTSNLSASWLNWTEWEGEPPILVNNKSSAFNSAVGNSDCPFTNNSHGFTCMDRPATMSGANGVSKIPSSGTYAGYICPSIDSGKLRAGKTGIYYNGCYTTVTGSSASCGSNTACTCTGSGSSKICHLWRGDGTAATAAAAPARSTWTGCVNDRDQDYDTKNTAPGSSSASPSSQFYAEQWSGCLPATVFPMSNQWQTLKDQITAMSPSGNTNQSVGLAWGWQSLSTTNGPIAAPSKASNYVYKDYIVLLSDGLNTQNRWSTSQSSIDDRQEILCQNIKADTTNPVTIFTIQVNISNKDAKSQVLQDCATNGNFQMITSSSQTSDAFKNILTQISKLRVAK